MFCCIILSTEKCKYVLVNNIFIRHYFLIHHIPVTSYEYVQCRYLIWDYHAPFHASTLLRSQLIKSAGHCGHYIVYHLNFTFVIIVAQIFKSYFQIILTDTRNTLLGNKKRLWFRLLLLRCFKIYEFHSVDSNKNKRCREEQL